MKAASISKRFALSTALTAVLAAGCASNRLQPPLAGVLAIKNCESLAGMVIEPASIGLPSGGARVISAVRAPEVPPFLDAEGEHLLPTPARCLLIGAIAPIDSAAPPINFAVNLPLSNWNGRALQSGGGGLGGSVNTAPGNKASGRFDPNPVNVEYPITQGYVTFGSDQGHPRVQTSGDLAFTRNAEATRNWAYEEIKKTRDAVLATIQAAYGRRPTHVFFSGESAGGREALRAAQKFPDDYDGVIATSPVIPWSGLLTADSRTRDALIGGFLDKAAIKLVADRTRASCDLQDGRQDGVIGRYLECPNDVASLRCAPGQLSGSCLTDAQVAAVNAIREPFTWPVPMANGVRTFPGHRVTGGEDGDSWQWAFYPVGVQAPSLDLAAGSGFEQRRGVLLNYGAFWVRHMIVGRGDFNPKGFDTAQYSNRVRELSDLFDATDPDLSRFADHGGKLIIVHPSADNAAPLSVSAEYYGSVVAKMGAASADRFFRLYVPAGGSHNVGGTSQINALAMLEDWVLRDRRPPDAPIAFDLSVKDMSFIAERPACRYPAFPRYSSGDPKQAASYYCVSRELNFSQH